MVLDRIRSLLGMSRGSGVGVAQGGGRPEPTPADGGPESVLQSRLRDVRYRTDQMTAVEYGVVAGILMAKSPCRLLVFGLGRDSELWTEINKAGSNIFLEDVADWFRQPAGGAAFLVKYPGCKVPREAGAAQFDVILVDGPMAYNSECPGRSESIEIAATHVAEGGVVLVHDYNRAGEREWCGKSLGVPSFWVDRLAVFCSMRK